MLDFAIAKLERFHDRCILDIFNVTCTRRWEERLTTASLHYLCATL